ncbi:MAG: hypothetical protein QOF53_3608, partial [Nocardioidaceae bacterium]|nr:hypothetical protein [Nocardioidaceae bacterium]
MAPDEEPASAETPDPGAGELPETLALALAAYERHLVSERNLAAHSVRAYLGDLRSML